MRPIVLVGAGENHYRLIREIQDNEKESRPVILVAQGIKVLGRDFLPTALSGKSSVKDVQLDLWRACQRKGVYFLEDQCLSVHKEEQSLYLKKFGKLNYHRLSIEVDGVPTLFGRELEPHPSLMDLSKPHEFLQKMEQFFLEVHKHCPKEVRVILSGFNSLSLQLAVVIKRRLQEGCEFSDVIILDSEDKQKDGLFKNKKNRDIEKLKKAGIRVISSAIVENYQEQSLRLQGGASLSHDILIPTSHWMVKDEFAKSFHLDNRLILVNRNLNDVRDPLTFLTGDNVFFEREARDLQDIDRNELVNILKHNIFKSDLEAPSLECRDRSKNSVFQWSQGWEDRAVALSKDLQKVDLIESSESHLQQELEYQAKHMRRPWQGLSVERNHVPDDNIRLVSFNGFNSWGSFALSAVKITELALLKCLSQGIKPKQLRFSLTLPSDKTHLVNHIFESTFKGIESVAEKHGVEIDGGDTFDGSHWHLRMTVGGEGLDLNNSKFRPHDYLIMTRPLGFGFLWAGRLSSRFNASWVQRALHQPLLSDQEKIFEFIHKWNPAGRVLIEDWGFLFHCLQKVPNHQQLMINFREIPRWEGTDLLINEGVEHPGLNINWERIQEDLAFRKDEVSKNNSVLWDSLSQGSLVFGIAAEDWRGALRDLQQMGYGQASLIGCIRPKTHGHRVVLSDWSPS